MAKKNKAAEKDRRQRLAEMKKQQQAAERRRTVAIVGAFSLVAVAIIGAAAYVPIRDWINDPGRQPMSAFGVSEAAASCTEPSDDNPEGNNDHRPDGTPIDYATAPPSNGPHYAVPAEFGRTFYESADRPPVEQLVHNLEHGYTVVWYDETIAKDDKQLEELRMIAKRFEAKEWDGKSNNKFIVAPWTSGDIPKEDFPKGKHVAMTRWTTEAGRRVYCGDVSGAAIQQFMKKYPWTDSPEPDAL